MLNEVNEHQPVVDDRGTPFLIVQGLDALDERDEPVLVFAEVLVKPFGDFLRVELHIQPVQHLPNAGFAIVVKVVVVEEQAAQFLQQQFPALNPVKPLIHRKARFVVAPHPQPDRTGPGAIHEYFTVNNSFLRLCGQKRLKPLMRNALSQFPSEITSFLIILSKSC